LDDQGYARRPAVGTEKLNFNGRNKNAGEKISSIFIKPCLI
jgi:hypothetical protein